MLKVDLHLHTSEDPADQIGYDAATLVDRAADLGFDALAITLHDSYLNRPRIRDYARERGIVLLPGIERTIHGRHVLLVNFSPAAADVRSFDDVRRLKQREPGLVIAPHPFYPERTCLRSLMDEHATLLDAVEWSYFWTWGINFNAAAARWARAHGKPLVGNSDLHDLRQFGRTHSVIDAGRDPEAICAAVRQGLVEVRTTPVPPIELAAVFGGMLWRGRRSADQLQVTRKQPYPQIVRALSRVLEGSE